ncbi:hypothetical protein LCGC14_0226290 [marine sediment metagenome]|uniref:Uncharacterized protein n=1 Tax=marine sediment metagenome TaxID=412755 RepID=A0A0F9WWA7_9ZZZZ
MGSGLSAVKVFNPPKGPFEKYALILVSEDQRLRSEQIVRQEELVGMLGDRPEGYIPEEFLIVWAAGRYPELRFWLTMHTSNFGMDSPVSRAVRVGPAGKLKPGQGLWGYERDETTRWVGNEIELGKLTWFTEDDNKRTTRIVLRALREGDPVPPLAEILYVDTLRTGR